LRGPPAGVKNGFSLSENVFFRLSRTLEYVQGQMDCLTILASQFPVVG